MADRAACVGFLLLILTALGWLLLVEVTPFQQTALRIVAGIAALGGVGTVLRIRLGTLETTPQLTELDQRHHRDT